MPRNVRTARGEVVDFDTIIIKQQLAQAPMNIEVERRKKFIDAKESKARGQRRPIAQPTLIVDPAQIPVETLPREPTTTSFEPDNGPMPEGLGPVEAVPIIPERPRKAK